MKRQNWMIWAGMLALVLGAVLCACNSKNSAQITGMSEKSKAESPVERGKYLVTICVCNDCHTPLKMTDKGPAPDMSRMLSGHPQDMKLPPPPAAQGPWNFTGIGTLTAFSGPWGITYSPNLTPDKTGIMATWTEEMFIKAMRTGRHFGQPGARMIQPPMPWNWVGQMTDSDLKAVYAYLRSIPPVKNLVPDYQPPAMAPGTMK